MFRNIVVAGVFQSKIDSDISPIPSKTASLRMCHKIHLHLPQALINICDLTVLIQSNWI